MAIKFPDSDGFGNPGTSELSFENDIALEFTTDSASYSEYGDADHVSYTQTKRPFSLSQYFRNGNEVPDADANGNIPLIDDFPTAISFSDFYGAVSEITIEFIGQQYEINGTSYTANTNDTLNLFTLAELAAGSSPGNNITVPFVFKFDSDTVFNNSIQFGGIFSDITIENNGIIAGRGGHGGNLSNNAYTKSNYGNGVDQFDGNAAIWIDSDQTKVEIINLEKGFIAGGGNGGSVVTTIDASSTSSNLNDFAKATAGYYSGGGGGWNGGVGGYGYAEVYAIAIQSGVTKGGDTVSGYTHPSDSKVVTSRSVSGSTGGGGGVVSKVQNKWFVQNVYGDTNDASVGGGSGGTGLNGGGSGGGGTGPRVAASRVSNYPAAKGSAKGRAGGAGGNGIGSDTAPHFQSSSTGTGAGGGNSIQFKTGTTIGTSTMTNEGRVYGNTDITIS